MAVIHLCYLLPVQYAKDTKQKESMVVCVYVCVFSQMINTNNHHYPYHHSG